MWECTAPSWLMRCAMLLIVGASALSSSALSYSRSFICFFDLDSDAINARCELNLADYVDYWIRLRDGRLRGWPDTSFFRPYTITQVEIGGHLDAAEASQGLTVVSERRARAVAEWLIAAGIPREYVFVTGYGDQRLLVPTPPGIAEPQNRRVEIVSR